MQAKSTTAHSSLFLANMPMNFHIYPSPSVCGHKFNCIIPGDIIRDKKGLTSGEDFH